MCSCVVAWPGPSNQQKQFMQQSLLGRKYWTDSDLFHARDINNVYIPSTASAPPSLGTIGPVPASPSGSSSWSTRRRHHYEVVLRVMMKKSECQFKLPAGELQTHLHAIFHHLRPQDNIKLAVRLESWDPNHRRYLVIISTTGRQDTDESIIVGCDFQTKESTTCTIGLVLPVWCDTVIRLDGDGGFRVECHERIHNFKPVSVQAMWSALQSLHRCVDVARKNNYFEGSLYLTWTCFYSSKVASERVHINEWKFREDLFARKDYFEKPDPARIPVEQLIRSKLKEVMMKMDLDNSTSRQIRIALERVVDMDLRDYKEYIDTEMMTVLGQMDCSSKILDYLYLGSEWNACNLEELEQLGVTHILNVTTEIDNFFPDHFRYKAVRLFDVEESDLLPHWNHTWKFIADAKKCGGKCLVHCKMGISRSAATVTAYLMKERQWSKIKALEYVKSCRSIVCPNPAFQKQLIEYEGILLASAQRHNKLFRSKSESDLTESSAPSAEQTPSHMVSPRTAPVINVIDEAVSSPVETDGFDLNRHLLDIATLNIPKVSRPKSWSPDEGRTPYNPSNFYKDQIISDISTDNDADKQAHFRFQNLSEPIELLVPGSEDSYRNLKAEELRKNLADKRAHLRRHTASPTPLGGVVLQLEELAQSEDSVFVHDGSGPFRPLIKKNEQDSKNTVKNVKRSSSPAALTSEKQERPASLVIQEVPQHTSVPSPMNSPSYKNAKNVDIGSLKSRFSDPSSDSGSTKSNPLDNVMNQSTTGDVIAENIEESPKIKTSVPVREIVAVIESPTEDSAKLIRLASGTNLQSLNSPKDSFVKGHYKTASLPPVNIDSSQNSSIHVEEEDDSDAEDQRTRSKSCSESTFSVKKIVTEIESRYIPETVVEDVKTNEPLHRSVSMPCGRKKNSSPLPLICSLFPEPVDELPMETDDDLSQEPVEKSETTGFYIGDTKENRTDLPKVMSWCGLSNDNNNNNKTNPFENDHGRFGEVGDTKKNPVAEESPSYHVEEMKMQDRMCRLSPEVLHVIREVGTQLLSDSDESGISPRHCDDKSVLHHAERTTSTPVKKRGIVRHMAREIEKSVRKLTGKTSKLYLKSSRPKTFKASEEKSTNSPSSPNTVINKLLMGEGGVTDSQAASMTHSAVKSPTKPPSAVLDTVATDVRVKELVDIFDSSADASPNVSPTKKSTLDPALYTSTPLPRSGAKDLADLVTPSPYRTPDRLLSSSPPNLTKFDLSVKSNRVKRSQSERVGSKPHAMKRPGYSWSFRVTERNLSPVTRSFTSLPELAETRSSGSRPVFFSPEGGLAMQTFRPTSPHSSSEGDGDAMHQGPDNVSSESGPYPVRDIIRSIERRRLSSSSVQRSSSMPSSSPTRPVVASKQQVPLKVLRKTKSTPLLGVICSSYFRKEDIKRMKRKMSSK